MRKAYGGAESDYIPEQLTSSGSPPSRRQASIAPDRWLPSFRRLADRQRSHESDKLSAGDGIRPYERTAPLKAVRRSARTAFCCLRIHSCRFSLPHAVRCAADRTPVRRNG
jgi:hypothetical protein